MITETTSNVNQTSVNNAQELSLVRYEVFTTAHGRLELNLKLHKESRLVIVHRAEDIDQFHQASLPLTEGPHVAYGVIVAFRELDGRLTFLGVRSNKPTKLTVAGERVGKLKAFKRGDWCGTPTMVFEVEGETRQAEAAGTAQLAAIRATGLTIRAAGVPISDLPYNKWVTAPAGYVVRYTAPKTGPKLDYIALEREVTPAASSTPTDAAPGEMALLPARAETLVKRTTKQFERKFMKKWCAEKPYVDWFPSGRVIELPAVMNPVDPVILAILRGENVTAAPAATHPAPKTRRYPRRQPRQVVGLTTYKYSSERLAQLPRSERHKLMQALDRLLDHDILAYLHGATDIGSVRESQDRFEAQLKVMKGVVTQARKADEAAKVVSVAAQLAASIRGDMSVYEKQAADTFRERELKLQQILKDWLGLDLPVVGGAATLKRDAATVSFGLSGYLSDPSLQITLSSSLLTRHLRGSIFLHERAQDVYLGLWADYDKAIKQAEAHAARRDDRKERRAKPFPYDRPQYAAH